RPPSPPAWAPDGSSVLTQAADEGTTQLVRVGPAGVTWLTREPQVVQEVSASADGTRAVLQRADSATPPELWLWDAAAGARRLVGFNDRLLREAATSRSQPRAVDRGDFRVHGFLTLPTRRPSGGRVPVVLYVHGGPHNAFGQTF